MDNRPSNHQNQNDPQGAGFTFYLFKRLIVALVVIAAVLYGLVVGIDYLQGRRVIPTSAAKPDTHAVMYAQNAHPSPAPAASSPTPSHALQKEPPPSAHEAKTAPPSAPHETSAVKAPAAEQGPSGQAHTAEPAQRSEAQVHPAPSEPSGHSGVHPGSTTAAEQLPSFAIPSAQNLRAPGIAFVEAVIKPMNYELNQRFWGWRPNDILNVTDNINNFQLGVLEVTRRTVVQLAERISRTGYNDAFDRNLENAMNWLMIKADSYWFPAPETKYKESLAELEAYRNRLADKKASFYTRSDNLIPLLAAYEDLLGSCDQNLVKAKELDGSRVGFTKADDYFYYAKGVSSAMVVILEAVNADFASILKSRNGDELLHHAIVSCQLAADLEPWIVTDGGLDGILANHRAHMAAPISHARFYLGQLIKTLST